MSEQPAAPTIDQGAKFLALLSDYARDNKAKFSSEAVSQLSKVLKGANKLAQKPTNHVSKQPTSLRTSSKRSVKIVKIADRVETANGT